MSADCSGTFWTPIGTGHISFNLAIRKSLDLFANVVHVRSLPGIATRHGQPIDIALIRENTQGEYSNLEHESTPGVIESLKVVTRQRSEEIVRFAFDYAIRNGRKSIACINKANIQKLTDGEFLRAFRDVAKNEYGHCGLELKEMIVDNAAMQLVSKPSQFDVVLTSNLYGNVLGNIGAGLAGGSAALLAGYSIGADHVTFEPGARHTNEELAGRDEANPIAMMLSSILMLRHLGLVTHAASIEQAILKTTSRGIFTRDLANGRASTSEFTDAVIAAINH